VRFLAITDHLITIKRLSKDIHIKYVPKFMVRFQSSIFIKRNMTH
jgi:hypothetical protein